MKTVSLRWRLGLSFSMLLVLFVAASSGLYFTASSRFSVLWLLGAGLLGLLLAGFGLYWCLAPLERVGREVQAIRAGERKKLSTDYPPELQLLTHDLNAFIDLSDDRVKRFRKRLDDLAHSFKTPLAIQRVAVESEPNEVELRTIVLQQVERMDQSVNYHLKRAATQGQLSMAKAIHIKTTAQKLIRAFDVKYAAKNLDYMLDIDTHLLFPGPEGDLLEILGNLGDNACKAARSQVKLSAYKKHQQLTIQVEDDGPGIPVAKRDTVVQRGRRGEGYQEGSGIGLALVSDIVAEGYSGKVEIESSSLGGACVRGILSY